MKETGPINPRKEKIHEIIFEADTPMGKYFDVALLVLILASIAVVLLESVNEFEVEYGVRNAIVCRISPYEIRYKFLWYRRFAIYYSYISKFVFRWSSLFDGHSSIAIIAYIQNIKARIIYQRRSCHYASAQG